MTSRLLVHPDILTLKQITSLLRHAGDLPILNDPFRNPHSLAAKRMDLLL